MRLLVSWLRDFVDVRVPAAELGALLSMRGFELAAIEPVPGGGDDCVIDLEVTANRPDCLSVIGLAREVATALDLPLRSLSPAAGPPVRLAAVETGRSDRVRVSLEDPVLCPRYAAAVAEVAVGPSPAWLAARLVAAGVRPINNLVDITNYVLMEIGQPMHAFDLATLAGSEIRIRRARPGERLRTLDGVDRALAPDMLVIADRDRPQAVAGVMGGADSEVGPDTRLVAFESAHFEPRSVRITSRRLGLKTEAAARFERGADIGAPVVGLMRACALLETIGAGRSVGPLVDCYPAPVAPRRVGLRRARIARLLGTPVEDRLVERVLAGLGFAAAARTDGWEVEVPTSRVDVARETDLVEEIARHYGYDRLPTTFPALRQPPPAADPRVDRDRQARRLLAAAGLSEAVTFTFIGAEAAARFVDGAAPVPVAHPLSEKFAALRPSLLPGLLESLAHNRHREQRDVRLFEVGRRFSPDRGERRAAALVWTGAGQPRHWSGGPREVDFFDVKGVVEGFCRRMGAPAEVRAGSCAWLAPGRSASIWVDNRRCGDFGQLSPALAEAADLPSQDEVYAAEIDLDALDETAAARGDTRVAPLPRFPSVIRDVSVLVADTLSAASVRGTIRTVAPPALVDVREFDRYRGKGIPEGRVSLSLRLTFRSAERTLTDAEVQDAMDAILAALAREHGAVQR